MNRTQMNDHLAKVMKQVELNPHMRTEGMYVPNRKTMADMDDAFLRKQLCGKAGGSVCICVSCEGSTRGGSDGALQAAGRGNGRRIFSPPLA